MLIVVIFNPRFLSQFNMRKDPIQVYDENLQVPSLFGSLEVYSLGLALEADFRGFGL